MRLGGTLMSLERRYCVIPRGLKNSSARTMGAEQRTIPVKSKNGELIPSEITLNHFSSGNENFAIVLIRDVGDKAEAE